MNGFTRAEQELSETHELRTSNSGFRENRGRSNIMMTEKFKVGDHVTWNSEAGHVSGKIVRIHTKDVAYKGHMRRVSESDPQYEIESDKTDHIAMHKGSALRKLKRM